MPTTKPRFAIDIMNPRPITAHPGMTCEALQELLVENRISGAPVVDEDGVLHGVISMTDILSSGLNRPYAPGYFEDTRLERMLEEEGFHLETITSGYVEDFMSRDVITAFPLTPLADLAERMYANRIHRLIVVDPQDNLVLGIVTTFDMLKLLRQKSGACGSGACASGRCSDSGS